MHSQCLIGAGPALAGRRIKKGAGTEDKDDLIADLEWALGAV